MDRIFMTRTEALELLLKAHRSVADKVPERAEAKREKLEALDRLLLDVRACRVNAFRLNAADATQIIVTD